MLELIWKETGWGTIIILAALTRIEVTLYEAAAMDGANGWQRLRHITLPGIRGVIVLLLILRLATTLNTGFEQMFLQRNAVGAPAAEVLDTFLYFRGIQGRRSCSRSIPRWMRTRSSSTAALSRMPSPLASCSRSSAR